MCITLTPPPPKKMKLCRLSLHFNYHVHFLLVQKHRSVLSARNVWKLNWKPLITKSSIQFSLRITLVKITISIFTPPAWDTTGTQPLQLKTDRGTQQYSNPRELGTQLLYLKSDRDTTNNLIVSNLGRETQRLSEKFPGDTKS